MRRGREMDSGQASKICRIWGNVSFINYPGKIAQAKKVGCHRYGRSDTKQKLGFSKKNLRRGVSGKKFLTYYKRFAYTHQRENFGYRIGDYNKRGSPNNEKLKTT